MMSVMSPTADPNQRATRSVEESAFEAIYREMVRTVYRYCTARLGRSDGEEVTAEVWHAAAARFVDGRSEEVTAAWLMVVARNKVIDRWRKAERRGAVAHLLRAAKDDLIDVPEDWDPHPHHDEVHEALAQLTVRHRSLLIHHHVDGMTAPEIADELGVSVSSIESTLARARQSFRRAYTQAERSDS